MPRDGGAANSTMGTMTGPIKKLIAVVGPHPPDLRRACASGGGPSGAQQGLTPSMRPVADSVGAGLAAWVSPLRIPFRREHERPFYSDSSSPRFLSRRFRRR